MTAASAARRSKERLTAYDHTSQSATSIKGIVHPKNYREKKSVIFDSLSCCLKNVACVQSHVHVCTFLCTVTGQLFISVVGSVY